MALPETPYINTFLVKIASRCNLACDYCYVYKHVDQSWREQPQIMSEVNRRRLAERIGEYVREKKLEQMVVIFHGGEPLLAGVQRLTETARWIRECVTEGTRVDFSLQTNGTLITEEVLDELEAANIGVSLSLDGPQNVNDLHRLSHSGASSFEATISALSLLEKRPSIYNGLIAVIDPKILPEELFDFFSTRYPPRLDFLLPDANYSSLPPGRSDNPNLYKDWLLRAFDLWFDSYSHLPVRFFDAVLGAVTGIPSDTDAFGFGDVNLLMIETDGSYHDLDVLKITAHGATKLNLTLESHTIEEAAAAPQIAAHRKLLRKEGIAPVCQNCPVVDACGGGAVAHRYSELGFNNPTVYCIEMLTLLQHAQSRIWHSLTKDEKSREDEQRVESSSERIGRFNFSEWERASHSAPFNTELMRKWVSNSRPDFEKVLDEIAARSEAMREAVEAIKAYSVVEIDRLIAQPATQAWTYVFKQRLLGLSVTSLDGIPIQPDPNYVGVLLDRLKNGFGQIPRIHQNDPWLRMPFGKTIIFERDPEIIRNCITLVEQAFEIIEAWQPALISEIRQLSPDIQFIHDPTAHPDKAVSFSDNSTPGALYIGIRVNNRLIDPYLLADSIIHEHRHQKLYLLQCAVKLFEADAPLVRSPWRKDPRPPSGLLHAIFVFVYLYKYWNFLAKQGPAEVQCRAKGDAEIIGERIEEAFPILYGTKLTVDGLELVNLLENNFRLEAIGH